jgi:hypothetical protein
MNAFRNVVPPFCLLMPLAVALTEIYIEYTNRVSLCCSASVQHSSCAGKNCIEQNTFDNKRSRGTQILTNMKDETAEQVFVKLSSIKFHNTPFCCSRFVTSFLWDEANVMERALDRNANVREMVFTVEIYVTKQL